jgi:hypothetical protein
MDKSHIQLNLVLVDCLLDINPTALYNKSFLQDSLTHVDRLLAGRLSKAAHGTKWADEGSKLWHLCFMELRRTYRNSRTGERHAPWLKHLLNNMQGDAGPLQEAKSDFFARLRSSSSSSGAPCRRSFASRSPPRSSQRGPLLRVASSPKELLRLQALMDGTVEEQQPPAMSPPSPVSTPTSVTTLTGSVFYDVAKGMACMVENEAGHAFSNQYTSKGEIREYIFPNGKKVELLVKAKVPRQVGDEHPE